MKPSPVECARPRRADAAHVLLSETVHGLLHTASRPVIFHPQLTMRHPKWIKALDLDRWADTNEAKSMLPEVVRRLVHGTTIPAEIEHIDFPGGEEIHRPGYDGVTKLRKGNAKVPEGICYWELGTNLQVKSKLDDDYGKRIGDRGAGDFSAVTYIAVTPRDYQGKSDWVADKLLKNEWKDVRVYDSSDLEQWLEMAPGVALWLARSFSRTSRKAWLTWTRTGKTCRVGSSAHFRRRHF